MYQSIKDLLPPKIINALKHWIGARNVKYQIIEDYTEYGGSVLSKKALLSYLPHPLFPTPNQRDKVIFSNLGLAQYIPRALNELGYVVDIVSWDDKEWLPKKEYDLFIGHGGINYERISNALSPNTTRIYFSTGTYWREFNVREAKRVYDLAVRRGILLPPDRAIRVSEESANQLASGIICLGNKNAVDSYHKFPLVLGINNAAYSVQWDGMLRKDFDAGRTHFLFFSGGGSLHKGLDLILEAFAGTDLHLHICQIIDPLFAEAYHDELTNYSNIHLHGHIPMRSAEFEKLAATCNWTILATACEGQPGATLECMAYGLIPVLSAEANIDLGNFGVFLPESNVADIRKAVLNAAEIDVEECRTRAKLTAAAIHEDYSPEKFNSNFKKAVQQIVCGIKIE